MSAHKKNWFRRLFGEVGHSSLSENGSDSPSTDATPSPSRDSQKPSASADNRGSDEDSSDNSPSTGATSDRRSTSGSPEDSPSAGAASSGDTSSASRHGRGSTGSSADNSPSAGSRTFADDSADFSRENRAEFSGASDRRKGGVGRNAIFDPAELDDVEFYRNMRVKLQPIEQANLTGGDDDFGPDAPVRPFSEDAVIRLSLDMPSAQSATRPDSGQGIFGRRDFSRQTSSRQASSRRAHREAGHTTFPLSEEHFDDRGPVEDLYRMGYRNLWQDLIDSDLHVNELSPGPKEKVWVFEGSSPYVGSAPIFLEELVQRYIPEMDMSTGLLFTMPSSAQMLVRNVTTGMELFHTIGLLATASADEYFKSPDKLSPRLHLWHDGQIETISDIKLPEKGERQTEIQIKPTAYLIAQMNEGPDAPEDWMKGFGDGGPDGGPGGGPGGGPSGGPKGGGPSGGPDNPFGGGPTGS